MGRFDGKVAIVTEGSSEIGESIAILFAKEGAKLTITGGNEERLSSVGGKCRGAGAHVREVTCNMAEFETLKPIIDKTVETFGAIDILVNNAGTILTGSVEQLSLEEYDKITNINIRAPIFLCKYALPHLRKTKGCIINVSSTFSMACVKYVALYSATKAALDHFTRCLASECAGDKVRINCINPGVVRTRIFDGIISEEETEAARKQVLTKQPLGVLLGDDIDQGIMYLCEARDVTGKVLVVDGGTSKLT